MTLETKVRIDPKSIVASMKALTGQEVLIGIPDINSPRTPEEEDAAKANEKPFNNAEIGYISEYGLPEKNIPARPVLIPGIKSVLDRFARILKAGAKQTVAGDASAGPAALTKIGLIGESACRTRIDEGTFAPLSPLTIALRLARGRTGTKPLLDTGQFKNAFTHVVVKKGSD